MSLRHSVIVTLSVLFPRGSSCGILRSEARLRFGDWVLAVYLPVVIIHFLFL